MNTYRYVAKNGPTDMAEGRVEAQTEKEAIEKVSQKGLIPLKIELDAGQPDQAGSGQLSPGTRIGSRLITLFSRQLASLLRAGVPILRAITIISDQTEDRALKHLLKDIRKGVEDGAAFSTVLARYSRIFPSLFIALIRAGEDSGKLPQVLLTISDYRVKQEELVSKLRLAMIYPAMMAVVGTGTVIFMLTFVMPRLMRLYIDMGQALPVPTKILIAVSMFLKFWWIAVLGGLVALFVLSARYLATKPGKLALAAAQLNIPLVRSFVIKAELARFSRTMQMLLESGIPILRAIQLTLPVMGNEILKNELAKSYAELEQGGSFGKSLRNSSLIPAFMSNMLSVGEESGKLDSALKELADAYERETDDVIKAAGSLIEPVMILGMGLIVGFIVISMLLPIFELNTMVR